MLVNDSDPDGDELAISGFTQPAHGSVVQEANGQLTYTPEASWFGQDSFTYTATDGQAEASALVSLTVNEVTSHPQLLAISSVTASSYEAFNTPANTIDGDLNTRWSAKGDGQWVSYDLGSFKTLSEIRIAWHAGWRRTATFEVEVSANEQDWTLAYSGSSSGTTAELQGYALADVTARYVRIVGYGNSQNKWNSISEVQLYGIDALPPNQYPLASDDIATTDQDTPVIIDVLANDSDPDGDELVISGFTEPSHGSVVSEANGQLTYTPEAGWFGQDSFTYTISDGQAETLALVSLTVNEVTTEPQLLAISAVTASSYEASNAPANTIDGDLQTRWSAHGDGQWISYDLGSFKTLNEIRIAWHAGWRRRALFEIEVSADGQNWTLAYSGSSSGTIGDLESYGLAEATARYVRITCYGNTQNNWNSISEVQIYGV